MNLFSILRFGKNNGLNCLETENEISKQKNCKIELLEVLGPWGWIPRAIEGF